MLKIFPVAEAVEPYRAPDLVFDGVAADLVLNGLLHVDNPGDLQSEQGLATQVLICLMTDRRVEASELRDGDTNRGWIGDSFDIMDGETPLGSRLWLLRRSALTDGVEALAESYVRESLQPLLDQQVAVRADVIVIADRTANRLDVTVSLYGRDGTQVFNNRYELLWRQSNGVDG